MSTEKRKKWRRCNSLGSAGARRLGCCTTRDGKHRSRPRPGLYNGHCAPCHGEAGEGLRNLYPPIFDSRFLVGELPQLPCIIRYGLQGEIPVGERGFNQVMPGNQRLWTQEITLLMAYMQFFREQRQSELKIDQWLEACEQ